MTWSGDYDDDEIPAELADKMARAAATLAASMERMAECFSHLRHAFDDLRFEREADQTGRSAAVVRDELSRIGNG